MPIFDAELEVQDANIILSVSGAPWELHLESQPIHNNNDVNDPIDYHYNDAERLKSLWRTGETILNLDEMDMQSSI